MVRFFGMSRESITWIMEFIKGTDECTLGKDSSVPLMYHDPSDLGSLILFRNIPKRRTKIYVVPSFELIALK